MSEQAQHTPGPWKNNADGMKTVMGWDDTGDLQPLAQVFFQNFETEEAYANARLIAAAPDMAAALTACLDYFSYYQDQQAKAFEEGIRAVLEKAGVFGKGDLSDVEQ